MQPRYISAIEIGSSSIKGAVATVDQETGIITVIAREQVPAAGCVRYGWINNVEDTCRLIEQIIDRLESNPRVSPRRIRAVYVAMGGKSLRSSAHEVTLRLDDESKITAETLTQLSRDARESFISENEIIEVFPRRFVIDSGPIANPIGTYTRNLSSVYNIVTCRPQMMRNLTRVFDALRSRLHIAGIIVRPLAEADLVLSTDDFRLGCALVDIGSDTTSVGVYKDGTLCYMATIPIGSHHITRDITSLGVTIERAEAYKLNHGDATDNGNAVYGDSFSEQAANIVRARAGEIVANIVANISYSGLRTSDLPAGITLVGGGSYLHNIDTLLEEESGMHVRRGCPGDHIRIDTTAAAAERSVDILSALSAAVHINTEVQCLETPAPPVERTSRPENQYQTRHTPTHSRGTYVIDDPNDEDDPMLLEDDPDENTDLFESDDRDRRGKKREKRKSSRLHDFFNALNERAIDLVKGPDDEPTNK